MNGVDSDIVVGVLIVLGFVVNIVVGIYRARHAAKRNPSLDHDIGTICTRISAIEKEMDETKKRLAHHEDKISRQVGALHDRINDIFGEIREITGMLKNHLMEKHQ